MGLRFVNKGNFSKTRTFFDRALHLFRLGYFDNYGRKGVEALREYTPIDSGATAESWSYEVVYDENSTRIDFLNSNIQNGCNIAIILQYGHVSRNGGWVQGTDYISPALTPIFERMANEMWRELRK